MTKKNPIQPPEQDDENRGHRRGRAGAANLAEGGMSPLVDRKDATRWDKSVDAVPTSEGAVGGSETGHATPAEPVGGWVDGSTSRGRIFVRDWDVQEPLEGRRALDGVAAPADDAAPRPAGPDPAERQKARERFKKEKAQAVAEAAAEERQEEVRNQQDAMQEMAEDENYSESDWDD